MGDELPQISIPAGSDTCHPDCVYIVLHAVQRPGVCSSMVLCPIKNRWSHLIRVGHIPDLGLPSVAILPCLCRNRRKAILTHSLPQIPAGSLRDREVACSASDRQGSNFESCVWRTVSSQSSHHPQEVLLAQFSLYMHKGGLKPDSFHFPDSDSAIPTTRRLCPMLY